MSYQLSTKPQQLFFFAFIVAIVANMKYIDIEFSNQPVVLPLPARVEVSDAIDDLIRIKNVKREQEVVSTKAFEGFVVPPSNIRNPKAEGDATSRVCDTNILKRYRYRAEANSYEDGPYYVYLQHEWSVKSHIRILNIFVFFLTCFWMTVILAVPIGVSIRNRQIFYD